MKKIFNKIIVATIATVSFAACTDVDICTSELHPHLATVELNYDWNGVTMEDSMLVMPYRMVKDWSCIYKCTPDGKSGQYIVNEPDTILDGALTVKEGDLRFLTFNYNANNVAYSYINAFLGNAVRDNNVKLSYKSYTLQSSIMEQYYGNDFVCADTANNKYVLNGDLFQHVYSEYTDVIGIKGGINNVEFAPKDIFSNYEFKFDISAQGVTVNKVLASLSGVPSSYNMTTGVPVSSVTRNVLFNVTNTGASTYSGNANVLGFMRSEGSYKYTGAGIIQLAIYITDAEGNDKVYNLAINLYKYVPGIERLQYGKDCTFDIDAPIVITNEGIELTSGTASWKLLKL